MNDVHMFNIEVAKQLGVDAAAVLHYITSEAVLNYSKGVEVYDGRGWVPGGQKALEKCFPYITARKIRTIIKTLKAADLITGEAKNRSRFDRTESYSPTEKALRLIGVVHPV